MRIASPLFSKWFYTMLGSSNDFFFVKIFFYIFIQDSLWLGYMFLQWYFFLLFPRFPIMCDICSNTPPHEYFVDFLVDQLPALFSLRSFIRCWLPATRYFLSFFHFFFLYAWIFIFLIFFRSKWEVGYAPLWITCWSVGHDLLPLRVCSCLGCKREN